MRKCQLEAVERAKGLRRFILEKFADQNESPRDFTNNSDYSHNAVEMVVSGHYASPRIRRDIALYLGRESWDALLDEFMVSNAPEDG